MVHSKENVGEAPGRSSLALKGETQLRMSFWNYRPGGDC